MFAYQLFRRAGYLCFLVSLCAAAVPNAATALEPGWDVLQVFSDRNDGMARMLAYDRETGRAALFDQGYTGFDRVVASQKGLRKNWSVFFVYNQNNILTYDPAVGEADVNIFADILGKQIKTYEFKDKKWDCIFPVKYPDGQLGFFFYGREDGIAAVYGVDRRNGILHTPPVVDEALGEGWDVVAPFTLGGAVHILLYNRGLGQTVVRPLSRGEKPGAAVYASSGWRKSWHAIDVFYADPLGERRPHLLLYDRAAGEAVVHAVNADGTIGAPTSRDTRWGGNWDFVGVAHQGKGAPAFATLYDRTTGAVAIYALTDDGKIGKRFR